MSAPEPAKAVQVPGLKAAPVLARDSTALLYIDGKPVTVDTSRFKVGPEDRVVRLHHDGTIDVGTVRFDGAPNWYGARGAMEPWRAAGPNMPAGTLRASDTVQILGTVIDP